MVTKRKLGDLVRQETASPTPVLQTSEKLESVTSEKPDLTPTSGSAQESVTSGNLMSATSEVSNSKTNKDTNSETSKDTNSDHFELTNFRTNEVTESVSFKEPKYLTFDRKETRLRSDQIDLLNDLTKALNRKRKGKGERLTDNTLIRVAVDLLLSRDEELQGTTEEELRSSVGL
ncbi:MAG: hypothetical protein ACRDEA_22445 [Microcystaceae cyanobacterium]